MGRLGLRSMIQSAFEVQLAYLAGIDLCVPKDESHKQRPQRTEAYLAIDLALDLVSQAVVC